MTSSKTSLQRYVPNSTKAPYRELMNSDDVQRLLLAEAESVASNARAQGLGCRADVQPGRMRAHARASTDHEQTVDFQTRGHNLRVDRALLAALQAIRRS